MCRDILVYYITTIKSNIVIFGSVGRLTTPAGKLNHHLPKACLQYEVAYNFLVESFANFELDKTQLTTSPFLSSLIFLPLHSATSPVFFLFTSGKTLLT